ncbi:MAG: fused MFS/spermidine synthase [Alphaproteobacteria bacterium]|nr:fused MFS/spermidine synthase [Alphaproteobacteria bacterium]
MKKYILLAIIFILGYTNLSYELIILRQLISFLGSNVIITSVVMAFILLFLSVGYYLGSVISFTHRSIRKTNTKLLFGLAVWYMLFCHYSIIAGFFILTHNMYAPLLKTFIFSGIWLIIPSVATGFVTASIGRIIHFLNRNYTGRFMAIDTLGSVFGSLLTTLVLMPLIGVSATVFSLVLLTCVATVLQCRRPMRLFYGLFGVLVICASFYMNVYFPTQNYPFLIKDDAISRLAIIPADFGQSKIMLINGQFASKMATEDKQFSYTRFINNMLKTLDKNKRHSILVLGAAGFSIGIDDEQNEYTFLDIEPDLEKISEKYFWGKPLGENKKLIVQDAFFYMLQNKQKYDVIILDVYSSGNNIPVNFVTADFFKMIKDSLNPDGYMVANIITSPNFGNDFSKRIDNTLRLVFPNYLSRQVIDGFSTNPNAWANVIYIYHNLPIDNAIYTLDKNTAMYGQF